MHLDRMARGTAVFIMLYVFDSILTVQGIISYRADSVHGGGTTYDRTRIQSGIMGAGNEFPAYDKCIARNASEMSAEQRIVCELIRTTGYEPAVRPVKDAKQAVEVRLSITLVMIFDMDERNQILTTIFWLDQEWTDEFLGWDPEKYGGIKRIRVPCQMLWLPDVVLYNNADDFTGGYMQTRAMVNHDGGVFWPPPTKMRSSCKVDITYFPFDVQECRMKFGTWTYDGFQVDVTNRTMEVDLGNYVRNGEWELLNIRIERNVVRYGCCAEPYPDVSFYITIRRRSLYYMFNIVLPVMMMSAVTLLVFLLPPESGEKIALGITVLLAFSVFMLAIAEKMPETSEFIPLIGIYLTLVIAMTSLSIIVTVIVINFYHYGASRRPVPHWACWLVLFHIARLVRIETTYTIQHEIMVKQQQRTKAAAKKQNKSNLCCCFGASVETAQATNESGENTLNDNYSAEMLASDLSPRPDSLQQNHQTFTSRQAGAPSPSSRRLLRAVRSAKYCTSNHTLNDNADVIDEDDETSIAIALADSSSASGSRKRKQHISTATLLQRSRQSSLRWRGEENDANSTMLNELATSPIDAISNTAARVVGNNVSFHGNDDHRWQSKSLASAVFRSSNNIYANCVQCDGAGENFSSYHPNSLPATIKTNYYVNKAYLTPSSQQRSAITTAARTNTAESPQIFETSFMSPTSFSYNSAVMGNGLIMSPSGMVEDENRDLGLMPNLNSLIASPGSASGLSAALPPTNSQVQRDTVAVLNVMLERQRYEAVAEQISREWRQIAQVIDRLLFIVFLVGIVASTITILVVMPAFYDKADLPSLEQRLTEKRLAEGKTGGLGGD